MFLGNLPGVDSSENGPSARTFSAVAATRRHLINNRRWRGQRFGLATRREEGASLQWGCDRRTTKWPAQRLAVSVLILPILSCIFLCFSFIQTPLRVFMRWLP